MYIDLSHGRPSVTQVHVHARMVILARRELSVNKLNLSVSMDFPLEIRTRPWCARIGWTLRTYGVCWIFDDL